jgi:hypothetical protein
MSNPKCSSCGILCTCESYELNDAPDPIIAESSRPTFQSELSTLINRYSKEQGSDTPDFILAEYLMNCLTSFNVAMAGRGRYYGTEIKGTLETTDCIQSH